MPNTYRITVTNESPNPQQMFFFQQPAKYVGGPKVYSNSIACKALPAKPSVGKAQIHFAMEYQFYAGVQSQPQPIQVGVANINAITEVPIDANTGEKTDLDKTDWSLTNGAIALSPPINEEGVLPGGFRIQSPNFNPANTQYNAGLAAISDGNIVLSNFVEAEPGKNIDVQPIVKFYVSTGSYTPGMVVNFDTSSVNAAVCDATQGKDQFFVTYKADGTWTVT